MPDLPEQRQFGDYREWAGRRVLDAGGRRLGDVQEIYLDEATDRPEWVLVGVEGQPRLVPLADASVESDAIRVAQPGDRVTAAPRLDPGETIDQEQERRLYGHYGLRYSEEESSSGLPTDEPAATSPSEEGPPAASLSAQARLRRYSAPAAPPPKPAGAPPPSPPALPPPPPPEAPGGSLAVLRSRATAPVAGLAGLAVVALVLLLLRRRRS